MVIARTGDLANGDAMPDAIEKVRASPEYNIARKQMADREWRLDHLYYIQDKDGNEIQFKRNAAQRKFCAEQWYRDAIVKARQLGFSTLIEILILDDCLFRKNTRCAIIDATLGDAKKKLAKVKFAYDRLPVTVRQMVRLKNANTEEIKFSNGSEISIGTTFRGDTPQVMHVSELGKISADNPKIAKDIRTGGFNAVGKNGKIYAESTAHGVGGEFYDLVERAKATGLSGIEPTNLDFKLHFFAWWMDPEYRVPSHLVQIPSELIEYFAELKSKYSIVLDANQRAWYAKMWGIHGPDDMKSEYPSCIEECFHNSLLGSYFKRELSRAREDKRIGLPLPYDPSRPVNTFWDIGMDDENCIWFHQTDGVRHRLIDFYRNSGEGLPHYIQVINDKQVRRGFIYGKHYGPHDLEVREWTSQSAQPRRVIAKELGLNFTVVPRIEDKADAIEAARRFLQTTWIDSIHCEAGVKCLDNYRKKWNEKLATWSGEAVHDWASHGADALMTGAVGLIPDRIRRQDKPIRHDSPRGGGQTWAQ
jgi:hypothetical protein